MTKNEKFLTTKMNRMCGVFLHSQETRASVTKRKANKSMHTMPLTMDE